MENENIDVHPYITSFNLLIVLRNVTFSFLGDANKTSSKILHFPSLILAFPLHIFTLHFMLCLPLTLLRYRIFIKTFPYLHFHVTNFFFQK
jgi:hypothetical protein